MLSPYPSFEAISETLLFHFLATQLSLRALSLLGLILALYISPDTNLLLTFTVWALGVNSLSYSPSLEIEVFGPV